MTLPRLLLASAVALMAISDAFATDNDGGKSEIFMNPPPGFTPPPPEPMPEPIPQPTVQPANQPSAQPVAQPTPVKTPQERLRDVNAEIARTESALIEKNGEIANLEHKITELGKLGARNPKWEGQLDRKKKQRTELGNRLNGLYNERTAILRVVTTP